MPRTPHPFVAWSQYLTARTAAAALTTFPVNTNLRVAAHVGRWLHALDKRHRDRARQHIAAAFPEWDRATVDRVTRDSFEHFAQLGIEVLYTPRALNLATWPEHLHLGAFGPALEAINRGSGALLITGHLGNWELGGYALAMLGYDIDAIARPLDNPLINNWLLGIRERKGMRIITKWNAADRMIQVLNRGGTLGLIADQNAGKKGVFVPFFGRLASTYRSIGLLALRKDVPIICGYTHRIDHRLEYDIGVQDVIEPTDWHNQPDPLFYITARYSRAIEAMIRRQPAQYLWMHRRWKTRPRHEREGTPMPADLRRNLESLPWMTPGLMRRLEQPPRVDDSETERPGAAAHVLA